MEELKTKCEAMIADLGEAKANCKASNGEIKDHKAGEMLHAISAAQRELNRIISTIDAYYAE